MDIINGERAIMNTNHKIKFLLKNASDLDFNIDDAEISYLINGKTNDSYLLDFKKFKLVLRLNSKNSSNLGINRQNESLILQSLDKKNIIPNLVYMDLTYEFIIYEYIEGIELDIRKTDSEDRKKLSSLIESYQDIQIDLPKFNYFNHVSLYWQKIKEINHIGNLKENKIEESVPEVVVVTENEKKEVMQIIYFDFDNSKLSQISKNKLINFINKNKRELNRYIIFGHTDTKGTIKYNMSL